VLRGAEFGPANIYSGIDMSVFTLQELGQQLLSNQQTRLAKFLAPVTPPKARSTPLIVNGKRHLQDADSEMPVLWALRDLLSLTGTKYGCGMGICGACTVHDDGESGQVLSGSALCNERETLRHDRRAFGQRRAPLPESMDCGGCIPMWLLQSTHTLPMF
jgi:hypothetical protein